MSYRVPLSSINASDGNVAYAQGSVLRVGAGGNVNAAGSMVIDATGNVSIGTTSVGYALGGRTSVTVNGTSESLITLFSGGAAQSYFWTSGNNQFLVAQQGTLSFSTLTANPMVFGTNNSERVRIDSNGNLSIGVSTTNTKRLYVVHETAATNTVNDVLRLESRSSGTPAVGMGVGIELAAETSADNFEIGAVIEAVTTDVTATSEDFDLVFRTMAAGAAASEQARITSTGIVQDIKGDVRTLVVNVQGSGYTLQASDHGRLVDITAGGVTIPSSVFSVGQNISIYNDSANNQTITQGASVTLRLAGTATTGNRTLAQRGICTVICVAANEFVISGAGLT